MTQDDDDDGSRDVGQFLVPSVSLLAWGRAAGLPMTQDDDDGSRDTGHSFSWRQVCLPGAGLQQETTWIHPAAPWLLQALSLACNNKRVPAFHTAGTGNDAWSDQDGAGSGMRSEIPVSCPELSPS